ncbi:hypothetical protein [Oceaniglobus indicus]|uniref:hypothetical protein n=1 Tax=Oceaniglobus indicus TaxID=2047749 RepID=UPI000C179F17|nr:hypothetical protein [Oceaniglobus indicus]
MIEWLLAPLDPTMAHDVGFLLSWHARLMVLAWAVLAPAGVIVARFFKVWPGQDWPRQLDDQRWWRAHRIFQYGTVVLTVFAALQSRGMVIDTYHAIWGDDPAHCGNPAKRCAARRARR